MNGMPILDVGPLGHVTRSRRRRLVAFLTLAVSLFGVVGVSWDGRSYEKPSEATLRAKLSSLEYRVTQEDATEPAFNNAYFANKEEGIYVDVVSGEPLFSSLDKYDSGTGWPSFTRPLVPDHIVRKVDLKHGMRRVEVRSKYADSHLGHVFDDGPAPTGKRYCINSASLRFVPRDRLEQEGYGAFLASFSSAQDPEPKAKIAEAPQSRETSPQKGTSEWAYFAGGCFWCMEPPFEALDGVGDVLSGFMGGPEENPSYKQVSSGQTGHAEVVAVPFDSARVSYEKLLEVFWTNIDPTSDDRQFCDAGKQYRPAIFSKGTEQEKLAKASLAFLEKSGRFKVIKVALEPAGVFTKADDEHQNFYKTNPLRYKSYRFGCGRDARLKELWTGFGGIFSGH